MLGIFFRSLLDESGLDSKLRNGRSDPEANNLGRDPEFGQRFLDHPGRLVDGTLIRADGLFGKQHI